MQVDGSGDLVRDHGEVLLFAVDLDCVLLLEDPMLSVFEVGVKNASSRRGKRLESARKMQDREVGQNIIFQIGKLGPAQFCFYLQKTLSSDLSHLV